MLQWVGIKSTKMLTDSILKLESDPQKC